MTPSLAGLTNQLLTQDQIESSSLMQVIRMTVAERREYYIRRREFLNQSESENSDE